MKCKIFDLYILSEPTPALNLSKLSYNESLINDWLLKNPDITIERTLISSSDHTLFIFYSNRKDKLIKLNSINND